MVRRRVGSITALGSIAGVGKSRVNKYGEAFLAILRAELALSDIGMGNETDSN